MATQRGLAVVCLTVLVNQLGFGIVVPLLPLYATSFGASAFEAGLLLAIYSLMQMLVSTWWGKLSDRIGRRPVIVAAALGGVAGFLVIGSAGSLALLFVGRALLGSFGVAMQTAQAWVADTNPEPKERARALAIISAAGGLGFVLGPAIGAIGVAGGMRLPFFIAAGFSAANGLLAYLVLPKTPPVARQQQITTSGWRLIVPCLAIAFVLTFAFSQIEATFALFTTSDLGYSAADNGWLYVGMSFVAVLVQIFGMRFLSRFSEPHRVALGLVLMAAGAAGLPHVWSLVSLLVALTFIGTGWAITSPSLTSWTSQRSPADRQGELLGLAQSASALARVAGPGLGGLVFDHVGHGAAFQMAGGLIAVAAIIAVVAKT